MDVQKYVDPQSSIALTIKDCDYKSHKELFVNSPELLPPNQSATKSSLGDG